METIGKEPKAELRKELNRKDKDLGGGWVLIGVPDEGPLYVQAYSDLRQGDCLALITLASQIMSHTILWGEDGDEED